MSSTVSARYANCSHLHKHDVDVRHISQITVAVRQDHLQRYQNTSNSQLCATPRGDTGVKQVFLFHFLSPTSTSAVARQCRSRVTFSARTLFLDVDARQYKLRLKPRPRLWHILIQGEMGVGSGWAGLPVPMLVVFDGDG